jgi:hypothetical protein
VGWLVRKPDGTAAYYKFGTGDTQWTTLPGASGVTSVTAGPGITITGTPTAPIINATATSFPGFGGAPPAAGAASAAGSSGLAAQSDHTHQAALEHGSYTAPAALQAGGVLQQTFSGATGTLALATFPAGRVPAGDANGDGMLRTDDALFYDEPSNNPRFYVGISSTLNNTTNTGSALHVYSAAAGIDGVIRLQSVYNAGNVQNSQFQMVAGPRGGVGATAEWLVASFDSAAYGGARFGSIDFYTGYNTADFQRSKCGSFQGGGLSISTGPVYIGEAVDTGTDLRTTAMLHMRTQTIPAAPPSGAGRVYYDNSADVGRFKMAQGLGSSRLYANIARYGHGTSTASASQFTPPTDGQFVHVTGTTSIDFIKWQGIFDDGDLMWLYFESALTLNHNTGSPPAGFRSLKLTGAANASMAAGSKILFVYDAAQTLMVELMRTAA